MDAQSAVAKTAGRGFGAPTVLQFQEWAFESLLNNAKSAALQSISVRSAAQAGPASGRQDACRSGGARSDTRCGATSCAEEDRRLWKVVGGEERGGIVVRKHKGTFSSEEGERLSTGSVVEELELEGERLHYRRLTGLGPASGWVRTSIVQRSSKVVKTLLVRIPSLDELHGAGSEAADVVVECSSPSTSSPSPSCDAADSVPCPTSGSEGGSEADLPVSLWHLLDASDPVARSLGEGTTQYCGAVCDADDTSLFRVLRAELLRIERDKDLRAKWQQRGIWSSEGHKLPAHDFVLRRLTGLLSAEGLSWASNLYEDAAVACNFHHDGDKYGGGDSHNPAINANITMVASFGATRDFTLRHDVTGREFSFPQRNGDIIAFDRQVDDDFMHGLHPADGKGDPRISVVVVGRTGGHPTDFWAPRFRSNMPLWLPRGDDRSPRLMQFSGIFVREAPHDFAPEVLSFFAARGSRVAIEYHRLLSERLKSVRGLGL